MEEIHIYHTNDLHSHFEHWPRIREFLLKRNNQHKESGQDVFLFDIGDHMDRWNPYTDATRGKGNISLLNQVPYTAVTIGNNEGITLTQQELDELYSDSEFDVICANIFRDNGTRPPWVEPYKIYQTESNVNIAVIGLTAYFINFYKMLGWNLTEPYEELKRQIEEVKPKADIVILLSHLGINEDEKIAREFPSIDVIIGAHTHHILHEGKMVENCLLGAAGKFGMYVGHIKLVLDSSKYIIDKSATLFDSNSLSLVRDEEEENEKLFEKGKELLSNKVANIKHENRSRHALSQLLVKTLRDWCEADCAFLNEGLILSDLETDIVTDFDLLTICPHPINPCLVELTGAELKEVLIQTVDEEWPDMQIRGFGFRGTVMGRMVYEGIEFKKGGKGMDIYIQKESINPKNMYKLAIPDMFTFGHFLPEVHRSKHKKYFLPEFLRDLLKRKLETLDVNNG